MLCFGWRWIVGLGVEGCLLTSIMGLPHDEPLRAIILVTIMFH